MRIMPARKGSLRLIRPEPYPWHITLQNHSFIQHMKPLTSCIVGHRSSSWDLILSDFIHTLFVLRATCRMRMRHFIEILTSRLSVFKLGRIYALFLRLI